MSATRQFLFAAITAGLLGGCGDLITYSKDARAQGLAHLDRQQYPEALGDFRGAVRQNSRDYVSYYYLGDVYEKLGQPLAAISNYKTSLAVQPLTEEGRADTTARTRTLDALGAVLATSDPRDLEINQLEARATGSMTGEEYYVLAHAYAGRGDADSAIAAYDKAAQQNTKSQLIAKTAGLYFEQTGQKREAEVMLRNAYRLDPADAEVSAGLRRLGVVPGPSLLSRDELAKPLMPRGPIPTIPLPGRSDEPRPLPTPPPVTPPSPAPPLPGPAD